MSSQDDSLVNRKLTSLIDWQRYQEEQVLKAEQFNAQLKQQLRELLCRSSDNDTCSNSSCSEESGHLQSNEAFDCKPINKHFRLHDISEEDSDYLVSVQSPAHTNDHKYQTCLSVDSEINKTKVSKPPVRDKIQTSKNSSNLKPNRLDRRNYAIGELKEVNTSNTLVTQHEVDSKSSANVENNSFENHPIRPALDGTSVRSFEDYLDLKIKQNESTKTESQGQSANVSKKSFLRKGTGLKRFGLNKDASEKTAKPQRMCRKGSKTNEDGFCQKSEYKQNSISNLLMSKQQPVNKTKAIAANLNNSGIKSTTHKTSKGIQTEKPIKSKHTSKFGDNDQMMDEQYKSMLNEFPAYKPPEVSDAQLYCDCAAQQNGPSAGSIKGKSISHQSIEIVSNLCKSPISRVNASSNDKTNDSFVIREPQLSTLNVDTSSTFEQLSARLLEAIRTQNTQAIDTTLKQMIRYHFSNDMHALIQKASVERVDKAINTDGDCWECIKANDQHVDLNQPAVQMHTMQLKNEMECLQRQLNYLQQNVQINQQLASDHHLSQMPGNAVKKASPVHMDFSEQLVDLKSQMNEIMHKLNKFEINYAKMSVINKSAGNVTTGESGHLQPSAHTFKCINGNIIKPHQIHEAFVSVDQSTTGATGCDYEMNELERNRITASKRCAGIKDTQLLDGKIWRLFPDGTEIIDFANGERQIFTKEYRRREMYDGSSVTVYADGTKEIRYADGRLRVKNEYKKLIADCKFSFNKV